MRQKILVVDENPVVRLLVKSKFENTADPVFTYTVLEVEDAGTARQMAEAEGVDLVLCDLNVPRGGGLFLCRQLNEIPALAGVPVVIMGERSGREERLAAYNAGAVAFVAKPFAINELYCQVRALLQKRAALFTVREMEAMTSFLLDGAQEPVETFAQLIRAVYPGAPFLIWRRDGGEAALVLHRDVDAESIAGLSPDGCRIEGWLLLTWQRGEGEYIAAVNSRGMGSGKKEFLRWLLSLRG